ncbi:MAG: hypothetical protein M3Q62_11310 [Actinomycetota bacterium]|nr:hypothetical protein [Rubrobacteraceae bacterium]MDQ3184099.1 hypothetical protein [Actinomycetota bacterium]MDQ3499086.1 hypothetical protein [Actinomycetota bacterium]
MAGEDELFQMELNLHPNEASGLLTIGNEELLGEHGWDLGFWAVLDEGEIEDCIAAIGHRGGTPDDEGWEIERLRAEVSDATGKTEDAEAITRDDSTGYVYILGSHFGSKDGPLQPKRGFVARFREAEVGHVTEDPAMELEVSRRSFVLHRIINDALEKVGPGLIPLGEQSHKALIEATIERGEKESKKWAGLVREDDYPINIEGAAFRENGNLLLGLRFPTTAEGRPILIELEGIDRLFDPGDALPEVSGFWTADAVGNDGEIAGVRDLALLGTGEGEELHLVTGNVDSRDKQSVLIQDYPGGRGTVATHFRCVLPEDAHSGSLTAEFVREFPSLPRIEGMSVTPEGRTYYVTDEDEGVHLRLTRLLVG